MPWYTHDDEMPLQAFLFYRYMPREGHAEVLQTLVGPDDTCSSDW